MWVYRSAETEMINFNKTFVGEGKQKSANRLFDKNKKFAKANISQTRTNMKKEISEKIEIQFAQTVDSEHHTSFPHSQ